MIHATKGWSTCKQIRIAKVQELTAAIPVAYATDMQKLLLKNKKAFHDFEILQRFEAGMALKGHEVKSLKNNGGNFTGAFVSIDKGECYLKQFNIQLYEKSTLQNHEPTRPRKLLLRKAEILKITSELNTKGVTLIPLAYGLSNGRVKMEIGLARGKKNYDKRHDLKARAQKRRIQGAMNDF